MFFPIGDSNIVQGNKPILTYTLIAMNVGIFLYQFLMPASLQGPFVMQYGSIPVEITHGVDLYTLFTCMFLHGGWWHLLGNMMFMWIFADNIEATIGSFKFILFYLAGGVIASITHSVLNANSQMPCVGASGAIAACLGAYLVMFPGSRIKTLILPFFISFRIPAILFLGVWILMQFSSSFGTIGSATAETSGVAYWAHIGGFIFGAMSGLLFRDKAKQMTMAHH